MSWQLLRIWHAEVLSTVSESPDAHHFMRTSYLLAPERWLELPPDELRRRTELLLDAGYRRRNHFSAQSGDPAEMWLICYAFEWVARGAMPADPERDVTDELWVLNRPFAPEVVDAAAAAVEAQWKQARPGVDEGPWEQAFSLFGIDEDGENWKILRSHDPESFARFENVLRPHAAR